MQSQCHDNAAQFVAIVAVSPGYEGDDKKDQDCAGYFPRIGVAAVCDGVSTSPHAGAAARMGVTAAPGLFDGDHRERLGGFSQVLLAHRWAAQDGPIAIPSDLAPAMIPAVREAFRHQLENAYQTTLVAVRLDSVQGSTRARIICCGDSALYAFRPDGALIVSTRRWDCDRKSQDTKREALPDSRAPFGSDVLIKVIGLLPLCPDVAERCGILPQHRRSWYVCTPLDADSCTGERGPANEPSRFVQRPVGELWLVPAFLIGRAPAIGTNRYRVIPSSRSIRHVSSKTHTRLAKADISVTPVLPDHFASVRWTYAEEALPQETHFVLASDGFYRAFVDEAEMWTWLVTNEVALAASTEPLDEIHAKLKSGPGDDDVSLVWVRPIGFPARSGSGIVLPRTAGGDNHGR